MKNYNKSFKVEITANMIADKLVTNLDPKLSKERKEAFVDCIVGPMCSNDNSNGLKHLYYGLFELDMDAPVFKESDNLTCSETYYGYIQKAIPSDVEGEAAQMKYERDRTAIGQCKLIGFDPYRQSNKYQVEYYKLDSKGIHEAATTWVSDDDLELISDHVEEKTGE
jgi:hypothetical protein